MDAAPDYASCSFAELVVLRGRINRRKFPERYQEVVNLIQQRRMDLTDYERKQFKERMKHNTKMKIFSLLFLALGPFILIAFFLAPTLFTFQARSWIPTTCVIHHASSDGSELKSIGYNYTFNGRRYRSERLTTSEDAIKICEWLKEYPDGSQAQCFVNPSRPQEAALTRSFSGGSFFGLFVFLFMLGAGAYSFFRPEQADLNRNSPWTQKELRRISYENIRNRDSK